MAQMSHQASSSPESRGLPTPARGLCVLRHRRAFARILLGRRAPSTCGPHRSRAVRDPNLICTKSRVRGSGPRSSCRTQREPEHGSVPSGTYRLCDFALESDLPLPELEPVAGAPADRIFRFAHREWSGPLPSRWDHAWAHSDGTIWRAAARMGSKYLIRFHGIADFLIESDGRAVRGFAPPHTPARTVRHLLLDQVMPFALTLCGGVVVHGVVSRSPGKRLPWSVIPARASRH